MRTPERSVLYIFKDVNHFVLSFFFFFGKFDQDTYIWVPITGSLLLLIINPNIRNNQAFKCHIRPI